MLKFHDFKIAVAKQFREMGSSGHIFETTVDKDVLWNLYLDSFPQGSNEIHNTRREYDCSACRHFIRTVGGVVSIDDNLDVHTIWDVSDQEMAHEFKTVANILSYFVQKHGIRNKFLYSESKVGVDANYQRLQDGSLRKWEHLFVNLPEQCIHNFTSPTKNTMLGEHATSYDVFKRGLDEITNSAINTVIELVHQNSLYRGQEFLGSVMEFLKCREKYDSLPEEKKELYVWKKVVEAYQGTYRDMNTIGIRNTVIGELLAMLSEDVDLEEAVSKFERMVAPENYRRTTALVTQGMVDKAKAKVEELGLTSALQRRYASLDDLDIDNVLFINRDAYTVEEKIGLNDPFSGVANSGVSEKSFSRVEEVTIDKFIADILPHARNVELLVENRHQGNLMTLITASDPTAGRLFRWDNPFSWSYNGNVTDYIKERVKKAGGNIDAELCCRLAWFNYDDLDLHMVEKIEDKTKCTISYRFTTSIITGGTLYVDMNAVRGTTRTPVENIYYTSIKTMPSGVYTLKVHQFCKREDKDVGFDVEIELLGKTYSFDYPKALRNGELVTVAKINKTNESITVEPVLPSSTAPRDVWGIKTQVFTPVLAVTKSPNFWAGEHGNLHTFFFLKGCTPDVPARGFYNEFLTNELREHRKVLEIVGGKIPVEEVTNPLCGIGFSSTLRNSVVARVSGAFTRMVKITF